MIEGHTACQLLVAELRVCIYVSVSSEFPKAGSGLAGTDGRARVTVESSSEFLGNFQMPLAHERAVRRACRVVGGVGDGEVGLVMTLMPRFD